MASRPGRLLALVLACAVLGAAVVPGAGGAAVTATEAGDPSPIVAQQATPANGTVRHVDPDTVNQPGDLGELEGWLGDRMGDRLDSSTTAIGEAEYEAARAVLGDRYGALLERYGDVVEATAGEGDDAATGSFGDARNATRTFAERRERFQETYAAYRDARRRGDDERARELARELIATARAVEADGGRLDRDLAAIENVTGRDLGTVRARVRALTLNTTERAELVGGETFVGTRLTASVARERVSFVRPASVRGRLVDENGTGLANRPIVIGDAAEAAGTRTNTSGHFEVRYRPVTHPVGAGSLTVGYVPRNASDYLGNETSVAVTVEPVTPDVEVAAGRGSAAFGDRVGVSGSVRANGTPVPGVPVAIAVGGVKLGRVETDGDGRFQLAPTVPAAVPAGEQTVTARIDQSGRAITSTAARTDLTVDSTETALTVDGRVEGGRTVTLSGRLTTDSGLPVGGQPVQVDVGGVPATTTRTDEDGRYEASLTVDRGQVPASRNVTVGASFGGEGTNLGAAGAITVVRLAGPPSPRDPTSPLAGWLVAAVAMVLAVAGAVLPLRRRRAVATRGGSDDTEDGDRTQAPGDVETPPGGWRDDVAALIEAGETDRAVTTAYGVARGHLAPRLGLGGSLTHWEFYTACASDGLGSDWVAALESLTETYEAARFAATAVDAEAATSAVARAGEVLVE